MVVLLSIPETSKDSYKKLREAMNNRFASENNKCRQRQALSSLRQDPAESLEHYIESINFRCHQLDVKGTDKMRYFVQGLRPEIKEEVLMRQPKSFEEAEHLARLKVAVKESIDMKDQHHRQQDKTIQMLVEKVASLSAKLIALGSFAMSKKSTN